jgi:glutamine synthetase type III
MIAATTGKTAVSRKGLLVKTSAAANSRDARRGVVEAPPTLKMSGR